MSIEEEQIPQKDLVPYRTYLGEGRFLSQVGYWDGEVFQGLQRELGIILNSSLDYGDNGFSPLALMPTLDEMTATAPTPPPLSEDRFEMDGVTYEAVVGPNGHNIPLCYGCAFYAETGTASVACVAAPPCVGVRRHDKRDVIFKSIGFSYENEEKS